MDEQMIINGVARICVCVMLWAMLPEIKAMMMMMTMMMIWCEGNTKRGIDCEDRDHCRSYGRTIRPWPLNFRLRSQTPAGASSLDPLETLYSKPHETAPIILGLRASLYQNAEGVEMKENGNGVSHSIPVDQRI